MKPVFLSLIFFSVLLTFSSCKKAPVVQAAPYKVPVAHQGIQGKAMITLKQGQTNPLDGLELMLCRPEAEKTIIETRDAKWLEEASPRSFGDGYDNLDLHAIGVSALPFEVKRAKTDGFGNYAMEVATPGSYIIYAQYKSRYAAGYWLIPVTIEADKVTLLNISNDNLKEIHNRKLQ